MSYSCSDFYDDVCEAAFNHLQLHTSIDDTDSIEQNANTIVAGLVAAQVERRELLKVLIEAPDLPDDIDCLDGLEALADAYQTWLANARAAIAKVQA